MCIEPYIDQDLGHCPTSYANDVTPDTSLNFELLDLWSPNNSTSKWPPSFFFEGKWPHRVDKLSSSCVLAAAKGASIIRHLVIYYLWMGWPAYTCWMISRMSDHVIIHRDGGLRPCPDMRKASFGSAKNTICSTRIGLTGRFENGFDLEQPYV